jgi:hypothetical protein
MLEIKNVTEMVNTSLGKSYAIHLLVYCIGLKCVSVYVNIVTSNKTGL